METTRLPAKNAQIHMLRMPEVIQRTGLSRSTIYALMADDKFPRQIKVSKNTAAWLEHEIEDYLIARIAERGQETSVQTGGA